MGLHWPYQDKWSRLLLLYQCLMQAITFIAYTSTCQTLLQLILVHSLYRHTCRQSSVLVHMFLSGVMRYASHFRHHTTVPTKSYADRPSITSWRYGANVNLWLLIVWKLLMWKVIFCLHHLHSMHHKITPACRVIRLTSLPHLLSKLHDLGGESAFQLDSKNFSIPEGTLYRHTGIIHHVIDRFHPYFVLFTT